MTHALECYTDGRAEWAGPPDRVLIDQDSAFKGEFEQMLAELGIPRVYVPREAHWKLRPERKIGFLKTMATKVFKDMGVNDVLSCKLVLVSMSSACNRLASVDGFSPAQWVLGQNIRLPTSLADSENDPCLDLCGDTVKLVVPIATTRSMPEGFLRSGELRFIEEKSACSSAPATRPL